MTQTVRIAKRAMFVWLPNFAMRRARLKTPQRAGPDGAFVLLEKHHAIERSAALDEPAIRAGLHLHQSLADAMAVLPALTAADADPEGDRQAMKALAGWAQRYSPVTAYDFPNGLWLDVTGCAHLWGGEAELAEDLLSRLKKRGIPARICVADTFGAAYAIAHHSEHYSIVPPGGHRDLLSLLPVERLRLADETQNLLQRLGLTTIGHVEDLPRDELSRRFPDLLPRLDRAFGLAEEAIDFLRPSPEWIERLRFADPISAPEDLERAIAKLLESLCTRLQAGRKGGMRFEARFFRADGGAQSARVSTALATRDAERISQLFREKLGFIDPGFGVDIVEISAHRVEPLEDRQVSLLRSVQQTRCIEELAALIDSLENRLGEGRVYRIAQCESYIPERAVRHIRPMEDLESLTACEASVQRKRNKINPALKERTDRSPLYRTALIPAAAFRRGENDAISSGDRNALKIGEIDREQLWERFSERPIRLFAYPQPIEVTAAIPDAPPILFRWRKIVHRIRRAEGPERILPEWWLENGIDDETNELRDYYRVENMQGLRFWVYRQGSYESGAPRWYLHGLFG